jgi:histidinol-phosphate phosphatase family protein
VSRPAAFLDRDGTIIHDVEYIRDSADATLLPGAAAAIRRLNDAGVPVIVITNQSGIARGMITTADYNAVQARVDDLVRDGAGARIDASYFCPHHPDFTGPCDCRKPGPLLFRRAASDHDLDLSRSAYIGDRWRDVEPALTFGGLGIVVLAASTPVEDRERLATHDDRSGRITVVSSVDQAVSRVLGALPALAVGQ